MLKPAIAAVALIAMLAGCDVDLPAVPEYTPSHGSGRLTGTVLVNGEPPSVLGASFSTSVTVGGSSTTTQDGTFDLPYVVTYEYCGGHHAVARVTRDGVVQISNTVVLTACEHREVDWDLPLTH